MIKFTLSLKTHAMPLDPFYESCYDQVLKAISHYIPEVSTTGAVFLASDYEDIQGPGAIIAMAGFLRFAADKQLDGETIKLTLVHDLAGRKDKLMLPRTSDYGKYAKELG